MFSGLTWKGIALIVTVCLINGLRRTIQNIVGGDPFLDWLANFAQVAGFGLVVAVPVALAVVVTYNRAPSRAVLRYPALALAVAAACLAGVATVYVLEAEAGCSGSLADCFRAAPLEDLVAMYVRYGVLCTLFAVVFVFLRMASESAMRAQAAQRDRAQFAQRMDEARLRMLQAQIEPHFLFNTLANVRRLYQTAPHDAVTMLDNLMRYLAVALPQMRAADSTLGRESDLTESYLAIQRIRMGQRLTYEIDIPEPLRDAALPPMMLITLVENAIKHGLAPLPEGGIVRISAALQANEMQVRVADSGRGFAQSAGGGTGLANIRARLAGMYGAAGRLTLALNAPRGITATIAVPFARAPALPEAAGQP